MREIAALLLAAASALPVSAGSSPDEPGNRGDAVDALLREGRHDDVEREARAWLEDLEERGLGESPDAVHALNLLVESRLGRGLFDDLETEELAERAVAVVRSAGEAIPADRRAQSLFDLGFIRYRAGEHARAKPLFESALAAAEAHYAADHPRIAWHVKLLGDVLYEVGELEAACAAFERALSIREVAAPHDPWLADDLLNVALCSEWLGRFDESPGRFRRALEAAENHPEPTLFPRAIDGYATHLYQTGEFAEARTWFERGLALREERLGPDDLWVASSLNNLALLDRDTGDYETALGRLERALSIRRGHLGPSHVLVGQSLHNLAVVHHRMGDTEAAVPLFESALGILRGGLDPEHPRIATTLQAFAETLEAGGRLEDAKTYYARALRIWKSRVGEGNHDVGRCHHGLGSVEEALGRLDAALDHFERARTILSDNLGPTHPVTTATLDRLAVAYHVAGRVDDALEAARLAGTGHREHVRTTLRSLAERPALGYASLRPAALDVLVSLAVAKGGGAAREALDAVIRSRALVLDEMADRHRFVSRSRDPELHALAKDLEHARARLAALTVRGPLDDHPDLYGAQLDAARRDRERAERALAAKSLTFRRDTERGRSGLEDIEAARPADTALVSFIRYRRHAAPGPDGQRRRAPRASYVALVLRAGDSNPTAVDLGAAREIEAAIERWRDEAALGLLLPGREPEEAERIYREVGTRLRELVWDPVAPWVRDAGRILVVPDAALHLVAFDAFPVAESAYRLESGPPIHYLTAERDLTAPAAGGVAARGLLAVGDPAFDETGAPAAIAGGDPGAGDASVLRGRPSRCLDFRSLRFARLPSASVEAGEVAEIWKRTQDSPVARLTGERATEAAFKRQAPGRRVVHVATHGFFLTSACPTLETGLRGVGGLSLDRRADSGEAESALALSGLALAGANHRHEAGPGQDDGVLTAEEIAALDLSGLEWAVLSACDTGVGEAKAGEGVFGLRRAFRIAGAETVIMSLWAVGDEPARQWMRALYAGRFADGLDTPEAVRRATLDSLRRRREEGLSTHPFFWAGWIASGWSAREAAVRDHRAGTLGKGGST